MLKYEANLQKFHNFHDRYLTEVFHFGKLILGVDCLYVEAIGDVAFEEVVIIADDVDERDRLLIRPHLKVMDKGLRHDHSGVGLIYVIQQQHD